MAASIRTLTPAKVMTLPRHRALSLASEYPGIARAFTWLAFGENAILNEWVLCLGRRSARERIAHLLCELSVRLGYEEDDGDFRCELPLTQEQIADALGLTPVHTNRMLQGLRRERLIINEGKTLSIPDMGMLRHAGGFNPGYLRGDRHAFDAAFTGMASAPVHPVGSRPTSNESAASWQAS